MVLCDSQDNEFKPHKQYRQSPRFPLSEKNVEKNEKNVYT